jgi:putative colanic acid biosynthesis UDP-glucose lipid carrier transferase
VSTEIGGIARRYHSLFSTIQRLFDAGIVFALLPALCIAYGVGFSQLYQFSAVLGAVLSWIAMGMVDSYRPWRGAGLLPEVRVILGGWLLVVWCLLLVAWATKNTEDLSRVVMGTWFVSAPVLLSFVHIMQRLLLRALRRRGRNTRRVVIVGAGDLAKRLAERIQDSDWMGMHLAGMFDDDTRKHDKDIAGVPVLGKIEDVYPYVRDHRIDQVYLALPMRSEKRMREVFDQLQDTTASLFLIPDLFIFELMGSRSQNIAGLPAFALCETPLTGPFGLLKRLEDVVLASTILVLTWPIMLAIAVAVKFTSQGPVIFRQDRYGLHGERIKVYKFRSMTVCDNDDTVIRQAGKSDTRVTPLGAFLRRTSLDELPQFINVLQGRMSVVGPRPHAVAHNEEYRKLIKGYMWRHKVKPGITGLAQVEGWRGETETLHKMQKRVEYDLEYIRRWSVWLDLKIVFLTIWKGFSGHNAY